MSSRLGSPGGFARSRTRCGPLQALQSLWTPPVGDIKLPPGSSCLPVLRAPNPSGSFLPTENVIYLKVWITGGDPRAGVEKNK